MTATKERPILFSPPMVRAILDGRKTQTRRALKPQPKPDKGWDWSWPLPGKGVTPGTKVCWRDDTKPGTSTANFYCPYGKPGDRLWVKETFAEVHPIAIAEGRFTKRLDAGIPGPPPVDYLTIYKADGEFPGVHHTQEYPWRSLTTADEVEKKHYPHGRETGWSPSMFMPRRASRLDLLITGIRIERLQDISEADAKAEGVIFKPGITNSYRQAFANLWAEINGEGSWSANPWVWAITFERVKP